MPTPSAKVVDLTGQPFGLMRVEAFAGLTARGQALWRCRCACGRVKTVPASNLARLQPAGGRRATGGCGECHRDNEARFAAATGGRGRCYVCGRRVRTSARTCSPACCRMYREAAAALTDVHTFFVRRGLRGCATPVPPHPDAP